MLFTESSTFVSFNQPQSFNQPVSSRTILKLTVPLLPPQAVILLSYLNTYVCSVSLPGVISNFTRTVVSPSFSQKSPSAYKLETTESCISPEQLANPKRTAAAANTESNFFI